MLRATIATSACLLILIGAGKAVAQERKGPPQFRHPAPAEHARRILNSVIRLDASAGAARKVLIDSVNAGTFWIEFQPNAATSGSATPDEAAESFLASWSSQAFGVESPASNLVQLSASAVSGVHHLRFAQHYSGHRIDRAQVTVHVVRASKGFVVQSVNGTLFPNVVAPTAPTLSESQAQQAAVAGISGAQILRGAAGIGLLVGPLEVSLASRFGGIAGSQEWFIGLDAFKPGAVRARRP